MNESQIGELERTLMWALPAILNRFDAISEFYRDLQDGVELHTPLQR